MNPTQRYCAAALAASLIFGLLELNELWASGPGHVQLRHPAGVLAQAVAERFTPAASLLRAGTDRQALTYWLFAGVQVLLLGVFIGMLWWRIRPELARSRRLDTALLVGLTCAALALDSLAFHMIVATALAALLPLRRALAWVGVQFALGVGIDIVTLATVRGVGNDDFLLTMLTTLTLERCMLLLGVAFAWLARQERAGRLALAASNAQLRATQSLLTDTVRTAERLRIARDLHDAVGHHLTALHLHLELAARQSDGKPTAALQTSRELAHSLLAQVRDVVSTERDGTGIELHRALALLCAGIPTPVIELKVDGGAAGCPPAAAHTLLCCVQEAITNAVRHSHALRLWIDIRCNAGGLAARIIDDGRGSGDAPEGNGLTGMRERLAAHGGTLHAGPAPAHNGQRGYCLELSLPFGGVA